MMIGWSRTAAIAEIPLSAFIQQLSSIYTAQFFLEFIQNV